MAEYIVYNNEMWKPVAEYTFTGEPEEFYLNPNRYLFVCNGARGGENASPGGTSYGIINLQQRQKFYAVVGGNGEGFKTHDEGKPNGGYNGGGKGGLTRGETVDWVLNPQTGEEDLVRINDDDICNSGTGGGGASDIRLSIDESYVVPPIINSLPEGYDEATCISSNMTQAIDLGYKVKSNTRVEVIMSSNGGDINGNTNTMIMLGYWTQSSNKMFLVLHDGSQPNNEYMAVQTPNTHWQPYVSFPWNEKVKVGFERQRFEVLKKNDIIYSENGSMGALVDAPISFAVFAMNSPGGFNYYSTLQLYDLKIYEGESLKHWYIPYAKSPSGEEISIDVSNITFSQGPRNWSDGDTINTTATLSSYLHTNEYIHVNTEYKRIRISFAMGSTNLLIVIHTYDANKTYLGRENFKWVPINKNKGDDIGDVYYTPKSNSVAYIRFDIYGFGTALQPTDITKFEMAYLEYDGDFECGLYDLIATKFYPSTSGDTMISCGVKQSKTQYRSNVPHTKYIKCIFRRTKQNIGEIQFKTLKFYDANDNEIVEESVSAIYEDGRALVCPNGQGPDKLITGNSKLCVTNWSNTNSDMAVTFTLAEEVDSGAIDHYIFATAGDYSGRDPYEWQFYVSADGSTWYELDRRVSYMTDTRNSFATYVINNPIPSEPINMAMLSRLIVANGSGGVSGDGKRTISGGPYGSWATRSISGVIGDDSVYWVVDADKHLGILPSQNSGSIFGQGEDADDRDGIYHQTTHWAYQASKANGHGGGGGGWYGGYASRGCASVVIPLSQTDGPDNEPTCGGSGSSYVVTESSYKPKYYLANVESTKSDFYMDAPLMVPNHAFDGASIKIYRQMSDTEMLSPDDKIIIPYTGGKQEFSLTKGTYRLKCWGGCTSNDYVAMVQGHCKGGYSEGVLTLKDDETLFAYVGSSNIVASCYTTSANKDLISGGKLVFNAAVSAIGYNGQNGPLIGGGATDLRIGTDSTYARVIVAGGAGGCSVQTTKHFGGSGGGLTGENAPFVSYGDSKGAGTQTLTPNQSYAHGNFGSGGSGTTSSNNYGPSGGNGWFGGNGVYINNSTANVQISSASGGSGYVLNEYSYKPSGYLLGEDYYLSSTYMEIGGNSSDEHGKMTYPNIEIDVIETSAVCDIICHDSEGYKVYDTTTDTWVLNLDVYDMTPETFDQYGVESSGIKSDDGLISPYKIYCYDRHDAGIEDIKLNVLPLELKVSTVEYTQAEILHQMCDYDSDENTYIFVTYAFKGIAENRRALIDISCDMTEVPSRENILYTIQFGIRNKPSSYYYPEKPEKTIEKVSLLNVSTGHDIPYKYKSYMHGFVLDSDVPVSSVLSSAAVEHKRNIYIACVINNTYIRFSRFNLIENTYHTIIDIPKTIFGFGNRNSFGGSLLVDDANMYYMHSYRGQYFKMLRIPFNDVTQYQLHSTSDSNYQCNAFGKMAWLDDHLIVMSSMNGIVTFNTQSYNFQTYPGGGAINNNSLMVTKYGIYTFNQAEYPAAPKCFDKQTKAYVSSRNITVSQGAFVEDGCAGKDDIIYIVRRGVLLVYRDHPDVAPELIESIPAPWANTEIMNVTYSDGALYCTMVSSSFLYMYDITSRKFYGIKMPFANGSNNDDSTYQHRPCAFKGLYFIAEMKMLTINYKKFAKYKVGQKDRELLIKTNSAHLHPWEYDERFVDVKDDGIHFHTGDISHELEVVDETNHIYVTKEDVDKPSEYRKLLQLKCEMPREEEDDG